MIDQLLTTARAIEVVGNIVPTKDYTPYSVRGVQEGDVVVGRNRFGDPLVKEPRRYSRIDESIDQSIKDLPRGELPDLEHAVQYDLVWHFREGDQIVVARQRWTEMQRKQGILSKVAREWMDHYTTAFIHTLMGVALYNYQQDIDRSNIYVTQSIKSGVNEALMNAIEHGSSYGQQGNVSVRMLGGSKGIVFFIDDPGKDFAVREVGKEYVKEWWERHKTESIRESKKTEYTEGEKIRLAFDYDEIGGRGIFGGNALGIGARGRGLQKFTNSEQLLVNSERTEDDQHRVIMLYIHP